MAPTAARRAKLAQRSCSQGLQSNPDACRPRRGSACNRSAKGASGDARLVFAGQTQPTAVMNSHTGGAHRTGAPRGSILAARMGEPLIRPSVRTEAPSPQWGEGNGASGMPRPTIPGGRKISPHRVCKTGGPEGPPVCVWISELRVAHRSGVGQGPARQAAPGSRRDDTCSAQSAAPSAMVPRRPARNSREDARVLSVLFRTPRCPPFWDGAGRRGCWRCR